LAVDLVTISHTFQLLLVSSQSSDILGGFPPFTQMCLFLNTSAPYAIAVFQAFPQFSPSFHRLRVPCFAWFLIQFFLTTFLLRHATVARLVVFLPMTVHLFHGSQLSWIRIFLMRFLLCHTTFAQQETFLQAAADFLPYPRFIWVLSFLFWRCSAARLQTLCRFLSSPTGITAASPLRIS
jgi:hypothetical protein